MQTKAENSSLTIQKAPLPPMPFPYNKNRETKVKKSKRKENGNENRSRTSIRKEGERESQSRNTTTELTGGVFSHPDHSDGLWDAIVFRGSSGRRPAPHPVARHREAS